MMHKKPKKKVVAAVRRAALFSKSDFVNSGFAGFLLLTGVLLLLMGVLLLFM
jgi:hypothetical protein